MELRETVSAHGDGEHVRASSSTARPAAASPPETPGTPGSPGSPESERPLLPAYLRQCRDLIDDEITRLLPRSHRGHGLYELVLDYPRRAAKGLRPALCIATCRALGGGLGPVLPSAAVLELFHNAFLVHDDIEDESLLRRGQPTLHRQHGVPVAINVGDAMFALCLQPLLDNTRHIGLGRALRVMEVVARMTRESVEGQAMELELCRAPRADLGDRDYLLMVYKKTAWYTFVAPVRIGGIVAGASRERIARLSRMAVLLGLAFQIRDDLLNLEADEAAYGKESNGDLAEGKRTLILLHALRTAGEADRLAALAALARPRADKRPQDVELLADLIRRQGSVAHARAVSARYAAAAAAQLALADRFLPPSSHRDFLHQLVDYTVERDR